MHPPRNDGDPWVLEWDGRRYLRISEDLARCAELLTGEYDQTELLALLGSRWDAETLEQALVEFQTKEMLDDGRQRSFSSRRVVVVPPMSIQLNVLDPSKLLSRIRPVLSALGTRPGQLVTWVLALSGLVSLAFVADRVREVLANPLPLKSLALVAIGGFVGTVIHELAHGATLLHYGGRPRRLGVMLFYCVPAFFCDVSDGWLLSNRMHRVRVALAGIFAQFVVAGIVGTAGALLSDNILGDALLLLALGTYLAAVINLIPFVKLDGYLALMAYLDIPNLRDHAMHDARTFLGHVLFGAERDRRLQQRWAVPYGLICMAFPLYIIGGVALTLWSGMLQGLGAVGAVLILGFFAGLLFVAISGVGRILALARRNGASLTRVVVVSALLVGAVVAALRLVPIHQEVSGYYLVHDDKAQLLIPKDRDAENVAAGSHVELRSNGVVLRTSVGEARVAETPDTGAVSLDLQEVMPVLIDTGATLDFHTYDLDVAEPPELSAGVARVDAGDTTLDEWLYDRHIAPVLNW